MEPYERELLERGVAAIERLAQDPVIEIETKPPVCPYCQKMNPTVRVQEAEAEGPLAEFVIQAQCLSCNKVIYALPLQWEILATIGDAIQVAKERTEQRGFSQG